MVIVKFLLSEQVGRLKTILQNGQECVIAIGVGICSKETYEDGEDEEDDGGDSAPLMILEFMQHGDLQSFLESNKLVRVVL